MTLHEHCRNFRRINLARKRLNQVLVKTFYIVIILFVVFAKQAFTQDTLILQPGPEHGKDAFVHGLDYLQTTNYGDNPQLPAVAWTFQGVPGITRVLIDFSLPETDNKYTLLQAILTLYAWDSTTGMGLHSGFSGSNDCWVRRIVTPWEEHEVTWVNQPIPTTQHQVELQGVDSTETLASTIDITELVKDNLREPDSGFGLMIQLKNESFYRRMNFASSDHPNADLHPKLELIYITDSIHPTDSIQSAGPIQSNGVIQFTYGPNPAKDELVVQIRSESENPALIQIINSQGMAVITQEAAKGDYKLSLSSFTRGLYFVRIQQGASSITRKLFIQ